MERRIFGLENEYGVTCTLRGQRRLSPDEVARYLFRRVVSAGVAAATCSCRTAPGCTSMSARTPSTPRPSATPCTTLVVHDKAGERILESLLVSAEQRLREEGIRGTIYLFKNNTDSAGNSYGCHENYLHQPQRRPRPLRRGADPVPRQPADLHRRRQGAADRAGPAVLDRPARRAHLGGRVSSATTRSRPIINTRDEPHADAEKLPPAARHRRRLQHERVHDLRQGRLGGVHVADAGGPAASCCAT